MVPCAAQHPAGGHYRRSHDHPQRPFGAHEAPACQINWKIGCRRRPLGHHKTEMWAWTCWPVSERLCTPTMTRWRQFGHKPATTPLEVYRVRALWNARARADYLSDALAHLTGWTQEDRQLRRTFTLDDTQHADLTERIKV